MLLLRSKGMRFGYDVAFHLCSLRKPHSNSLMEPTSTLTIFIIELTFYYKKDSTHALLR